jgi:hypothetical protein
VFSSAAEVWCIMNLLLGVKKWIRNSLWPFYDICKKQCQRQNWNFSRNTACFFTVTTLPCIWCCPFGSFLQKQNISVSTAILQFWSLFNRLFLVPRLES